MNTATISLTLVLVLSGFLSIGIGKTECAQSLTVAQIQANLLANPPNGGDPEIREESIMALDAMLKDDASRTSQDILDFYNSMMEKVEVELQEDVPEDSAAIWMMYNHGFLVKTSDIVFAFDLVHHGNFGWSTELPSEIIEQVEVLFVSHSHADHYEADITRAVKANDGYVVVPHRSIWMGNVGMAPGDTATFSGLHVKAHEGHHSVTVAIFEVTCPNSLKFLHTGDNDYLELLPEACCPDVLMLNAWIQDEFQIGTEAQGMRNCINRVNSRVMIPGHIQELRHDYDPTQYGSRVTYEPAFKVDDEPVPGEVMVMAWGERYFIAPEQITSVSCEEDRSIPDHFKLHQNFPNPFNPATTIQYELHSPASVSLVIYNILGQKVRTLVYKSQPAGSYETQWDSLSDEGIPVPSGIYFYRIRAGGFVQTQKMLLLR